MKEYENKKKQDFFTYITYIYFIYFDLEKKKETLGLLNNRRNNKATEPS